MNTIRQLIEDLEVYGDSEEICRGLDAESQYYKHKTGLYPYYSREAYAQIDGLWGLANRMADELKKYEQSSS